MGRYGLGSNNLLFMACELLLLGQEPDGLPLLLVEEPEAHLHPQRQLTLMEFLRQAAEGTIEGTNRAVQVLLSTHSPNLASKIPLANLVLLQGRRAFSLANDQTLLETGDYRFLERFLNVTKANLFFAHGVLIVEGDAEAIILPTLADLIGHDLTKHGVSIVNVGGKRIAALQPYLPTERGRRTDDGRSGCLSCRFRCDAGLRAGTPRFGRRRRRREMAEQQAQMEGSSGLRRQCRRTRPSTVRAV